MISVYSDGASGGKTGRPGGFGWLIRRGNDVLSFGYGGDPSTTNQRMELMGAIAGLADLKKAGYGSGLEKIELVSDSTYALNLANQSYEAKKNKDLVSKLVELSRQFDLITRWVEGHSGEKWNEICDKLAVHGKKSVREVGFIKRGEADTWKIYVKENEK